MITQVEIARRVRVDVSCVNKILNRVPGPVFKPETIAKVFRVARDLGYDFKRETKPILKRRVEELEKGIRGYLTGSVSTDQLKEILNQKRQSA